MSIIDSTSLDGAQGELARRASEARSSDALDERRALGERLRDARLAAGLKQYELAERLSVSRSAVSSWEKGQGISHKKLFLFARTVNVSAEYLVTGENRLSGALANVDPVYLLELMSEAFECLGKAKGPSAELARAILKAAERPQAGDRAPSDPDLARGIVQFLIRMYAC